MASPGPSSPPPTRSTSRRAPSAAAASNAGPLPADVLFDVLLRLPAKELCRLRAVCRAWRSLTADPLFAGAHAARHRGPCPSLLAKFRDNEARIHVVDLRGGVLKRMACPGDGHELLCTRLDLACVASKDNSCRVLNPATGAAYALPESPAPEHAGRENSRDPYTFFASGRVATTGECKVLRVFNRTEFDAFDQQQLFEVFTINGGASDARWRARESHSLFLEANNAAVVGGVVYFLTDCAYDLKLFFGVNTGVHPDCIASFDLGTEVWRSSCNNAFTALPSHFAKSTCVLHISIFNLFVNLDPMHTARTPPPRTRPAPSERSPRTRTRTACRPAAPRDRGQLGRPPAPLPAQGRRCCPFLLCVAAAIRSTRAAAPAQGPGRAPAHDRCPPSLSSYMC